MRIPWKDQNNEFFFLMNLSVYSKLDLCNSAPLLSKNELKHIEEAHVAVGDSKISTRENMDTVVHAPNTSL